MLCLDLEAIRDFDDYPCKVGTICMHVVVKVEVTIGITEYNSTNDNEVQSTRYLDLAYLE